MPSRRSAFAIIPFAAAALLLTGCSSYYRVVDPTSGREYLTDDLESNSDSGAVVLKDAKTGGRVTLQNSEVHKISKADYDAMLKSPRPAPDKR